MNPYGVIYLALNTVNGKFYIGKTKNSLRQRIKSHMHSMRKGSDTHFHNAIRKYGIKVFEWFIINKCYSGLFTINRTEVFYIRKWSSKKLGYNMTDGGDGAGRMSKETKAKLAKINLGKKHKPESLLKMSIASTGRPNKKGEESPFYKKPRPKEVRDRIGTAHKGKKHSQERILKNSKIRGGKPFKNQYGEIFNTQNEAAKKLNLSRGNISLVLHKKVKSTKGFVFTFLDD